MTKLKLLHTADFHLGVWPVGLPIVKRRIRLKDYEDQLSRIKNYAVESGCEFLVIAGDIFHTVKPSSLLLDIFARFVSSLTSRGVSVVAVAGTHDKPKTEDTPSYLKALSDADIPLFYFTEEPTVMHLKGRISGRIVRFSMIPYILTPTSDRNASRSKIIERVRGIVARDGDSYDYSVAVAHLTVDEAYVKGLPADILQEVSIPVSVFSEVDYTCLGHIHRHQAPSENAVYPGSIERIDFDEEDDVKGFILVEEEGGGLRWSFEELPCRSMKSIPSQGYIDLSIEDSLEDTLTSLLKSYGDVKDAIIRLKVKVSEGQHISFTSIEDVMDRFGVFHWILDVERVRMDHPKPSRYSRLSSLEDLFKEYVSTMLAGTLDSVFTENVISEGLKLLEVGSSED
ncbi:MAG: exonuclease SbcCD subunit D [Nitrososphaerota archaeon]|nr:exonuclease SbcCD subunit D [Nitrososphaerota archaeon]